MDSPEQVTAESLAAETLRHAPEPTATVPRPDGGTTLTYQLRPPPAGAPSSAPTERDAIGRLYDAAKFFPDKDSLGRWKNRRAGRRGPDAADPSVTNGAEGPRASGSFVAPDPEPPSGLDMTVETCIGIIQTALVMLGEEEGVLSDQEKLLLRAPLERVLKKYDVGEMPAELDLAVAVAAIVISRLQRPKTQGRIERLKLWFAGKLADRRGARRAETVREAVAMPGKA